MCVLLCVHQIVEYKYSLLHSINFPCELQAVVETDGINMKYCTLIFNNMDLYSHGY